MQKKLKKKRKWFCWKKVDGAEKNKNSRRDALFDTNSIRNRINDDNDLGQLSSNDKKKIQDALQEFENWMKKNPNATSEEIEKERKKLNEKN